MRLSLICLTLVFFTGCLSPKPDEAPLLDSLVETVQEDTLRDRLDHVLEFTLKDRKLNTRDHAAWQILHGVLAYQHEFKVEHQGRMEPTVDYLLSGGTMRGWTVQPGIVLDSETGRRGLLAVLEAGTKTGQGHADQWLAVLAQCGLSETQEIKVGDHTYTIADYVAQVQWDLPRNTQQEFSWTLIGLTTYLPCDATWESLDGETWGIERLMEVETDYPLGEGACGGTHRLIGITMALNRYRESGGEIEGVWARADGIIQEAINRVQSLQNPDGSFSSNYLQRGGNSPDLAQKMSTTGHVLEFLALALPDDQLKQPWMQRAAMALCDIFEQTKGVPLECGSLYHAAHGLVLYRERVYGPRTYSTSSSPDDAITHPVAE